MSELLVDAICCLQPPSPSLNLKGIRHAECVLYLFRAGCLLGLCFLVGVMLLFMFIHQTILC